MSDTVPESDREEMMAQHRKEKKELQSKIQSMKKMKVDKKKKKEIQDQIASMEAEMEERHAEELKRLTISSAESPVENSNAPQVDENGLEPQAGHQEELRLSKAQRRREKKEQEDRERATRIKEEEAVLHKSSPRVIENNRINEILRKREMTSFAVPADGDCLYNAINHQLELHGIGSYSVADLRNLAADYIEENKDSLICYMSHPDTGDMLDSAGFDKYCHQVRSTKAWGGEIEIKALSSTLKCPIEIVQATGPSTIHGQNEDNAKKLILTYHRHMYRLGEHYNSTKPVPPPTEDDVE
ncbi:deubiquitinase OTUD6B-like [Anopheles albimanus]|uniref:deubiquitinase OTUD6B-like n=1 Tax=Anopheles albimanus TaxID=7167 RepID=UPI0016400489|nr:deubiquitinase OTUD6B-like [Anopheles albimanus]